jgi:hypothetical protein
MGGAPRKPKEDIKKPTMPEPPAPKEPLSVSSTSSSASSGSASSATPGGTAAPSTPALPAPGSTIMPWGAEEDESLQTLAKFFQYNWTLVADCLKAQKYSRYARRTEWACYNRFMDLKEQSKAAVTASNAAAAASAAAASSSSDGVNTHGGGADDAALLMPPPKALGKKEVAKQKSASLKADRHKRFQKLLASFDMITKCAKKRDGAKPARKERERWRMSDFFFDTHSLPFLLSL